MHKYHLVEFVWSFCMLDDWYPDRFIFNFFFLISNFCTFIQMTNSFVMLKWCTVMLCLIQMIYTECLSKLVLFWGGGG